MREKSWEKKKKKRWRMREGEKKWERESENRKGERIEEIERKGGMKEERGGNFNREKEDRGGSGREA